MTAIQIYAQKPASVHVSRESLLKVSVGIVISLLSAASLSLLGTSNAYPAELTPEAAQALHAETTSSPDSQL